MADETEVWQDIATAPREGQFIAKIHHGSAGYVEVTAEYHEPTGGVFDVRDESCVGWRPGYPPAFWKPLPERRINR